MFNLSCYIARKFSIFIRIVLDFDEEEKKFSFEKMNVQASNLTHPHRKKYFLSSFWKENFNFDFCESIRATFYIPLFVRT